MNRQWRMAIACGVISYFAACAPVQFQGTPPPACHGSALECQQVCTGSSCSEKFKDEKTVGNGIVDILFVDDNSGSMSDVQAKMASKFPGFITSLGALDYRIGITTTDISSTFSQTPLGLTNYPRAANGNGAWQDGNLLAFPGSEGGFISPASPDPIGYFNQTIQRAETRTCEASGYDVNSCPSGDTRGIYALNLVLDRSATQILRPQAHLAVIILSDADERALSDPRAAAHDANGNVTVSDTDFLRLFPQENYDLPDTFVSRFKSQYPDKTLSVHSIIIRPGDKACAAARTSRTGNPLIRGFEGYAYARLSQLTHGVLGDICADNFTEQLGQIGASISNQVTSMSFACRPLNDNYTITFDPQPPTTITTTADFNQLVVRFNQTIPANTHITLEYECDSSARK